MQPKLEPQAPEPYAVRMSEARRRLANKSRSGMYEAIAAGKLIAVKDGARLLITVESINRYSASLPAAKIKPPKPRSAHSDRRRHKR
jgi:hypothetical protein